jgi:hypothetical protein
MAFLLAPKPCTEILQLTGIVPAKFEHPKKKLFNEKLDDTPFGWREEIVG